MNGHSYGQYLLFTLDGLSFHLLDIWTVMFIKMPRVCHFFFSSFLLFFQFGVGTPNWKGRKENKLGVVWCGAIMEGGFSILRNAIDPQVYLQTPSKSLDLIH